ncbi:MAG: polysaccharide deacetylase family protein [Burkholderiales bacterium]|nr:polysaccharide deacetylase family protein [Burkholderiales bacterium]
MARLLLGALSGAGTRGRLSILIYHRVHAVADPMFPSEPDAARFETLVARLRQRFNVLPLDDAVARLQGGHLPSRALALTLDDGYADNLEVAAPILERHGVPATIFVATAYLHGRCMWNDIVIEACRTTTKRELDLGFAGLDICAVGDIGQRRTLADRLIDKLKYVTLDERDAAAARVARAAEVEPARNRMMTPAGVRALAGYGIAVGAHTCRHPILAETSDAVAWQEIAESRRVLEEIVGKPVTLFAYPNGKPGRDYRAQHVRMVREAGFTAAVSTAPGASSRASDVYQLPRFTPWRDSPMRFDLLMMQNLRRGMEPRAV